MRARRLLLLAATLTVLAGAVVARGVALPNPVATQVFGPSMARADVVATTRGVVRLQRIDRGRVQSVGNGSIVLLWRDGTTATVPVAENARIAGVRRPFGQRGALATLRRGMHVATVREGAMPATRVRVLRAAAPLPRGFLGPALGPALSRAAVVHRTPLGMTFYRLDRGRIRSVDSDSVTLLERDGTLVSVEIAPDAIVTGAVRGRPRGRIGTSAAVLRRGMLVETVREGEGPAGRVHVVAR